MVLICDKDTNDLIKPKDQPVHSSYATNQNDLPSFQLLIPWAIIIYRPSMLK